MQYRNDKNGQPISVLGYGCMRFTKNGRNIDFDKAEKELMKAYELGVNYFDTAYIYTGSEALLGEVFGKNQIRDKINIATKLPQYLVGSTATADRYFNEELKRLRTDYIDYYLMHMITDINQWDHLEQIGMKEWISNKKKSGQIRQVGFSYHGNSDMFCHLVDAYDWDFCQIQYNYMDENSQAGVTGLRYAAAKGLPVIIMEPLRGGRLVKNLPKDALRIFQSAPERRSPAEWAFRWLWDQSEVTCVLSGMNSLAMVEENLRAADAARPGCMTEEDRALLRRVSASINARMKVPCTGCRYCMPCPHQVDIPGTFAAYNRLYSDGRFAAYKEYFMCTALRKNATGASMCIGCGRCEQHCPQSIPIREMLRAAKKELEGPLYRIGKKGARLFMKY